MIAAKPLLLHSASTSCVCEGHVLPQSWSLNDCAVPSASRLKPAAAAFLPPSTEASCFVRTVFLADEAFFVAIRFAVAQCARRNAAPCF